MAFLSSLDIAGSGITAQQKRLDIIAENIANRETLRTDNGGPYRRKLTVFREIMPKNGFSDELTRAQKRRLELGISFKSDEEKLARMNSSGAKGGVMVSEVIEDESEFVPVYDPNHPDADEDGYVMMPNVDSTVEMIDAMGATRSFSANVASFEAMKTMISHALQIGK